MEEVGFSGGDGENVEGLARLKEFGGVTRELLRALSRATSQPPSVAAEQQDSTVRRTEDAAEDKEPTKTRSTLFPETVDTLPLSETVDKKLAIVGGEAANEMRCRNRN